MENKITEPVKFDSDKPRTDLIPPQALLQIAEVFAFGAKKYDDRNWEKGLLYHRIYGAMLRHLYAFWGGEDNDPESGKSHLAHAGCCLFMLMGTVAQHPELDDRPHKFQEKLKLKLNK